MLLYVVCNDEISRTGRGSQREKSCTFSQTKSSVIIKLSEINNWRLIFSAKKYIFFCFSSTPLHTGFISNKTI